MLTSRDEELLFSILIISVAVSSDQSTIHETMSLWLSQKKNYRRGGGIPVGVVSRVQFLVRGVVQVEN